MTNEVSNDMKFISPSASFDLCQIKTKTTKQNYCNRVYFVENSRQMQFTLNLAHVLSHSKIDHTAHRLCSIGILLSCFTLNCRAHLHNDFLGYQMGCQKMPRDTKRNHLNFLSRQTIISSFHFDRDWRMPLN